MQFLRYLLTTAFENTHAAESKEGSHSYQCMEIFGILSHVYFDDPVNTLWPRLQELGFLSKTSEVQFCIVYSLKVKAFERILSTKPVRLQLKDTQLIRMITNCSMSDVYRSDILTYVNNVTIST